MATMTPNELMVLFLTSHDVDVYPHMNRWYVRTYDGANFGPSLPCTGAANALIKRGDFVTGRDTNGAVMARFSDSALALRDAVRITNERLKAAGLEPFNEEDFEAYAHPQFRHDTFDGIDEALGHRIGIDVTELRRAYCARTGHNEDGTKGA